MCERNPGGSSSPPLKCRTGDGERHPLVPGSTCPRSVRMQGISGWDIHHIEQRPRIDCCHRGRREIVLASSPRLRSESGSAHSCIASPKPFGEGGDQSGCRSCRSTAGAFGLTSVDPNARRTATNQSCGVRNFRVSSRQASGSSMRALATAFRSPSLERKARARRSTAAAGGSSLMKWVASLVATNRAVDGARTEPESRVRLRRRPLPCSAA